MQPRSLANELRQVLRRSRELAHQASHLWNSVAEADERIALMYERLAEHSADPRPHLDAAARARAHAARARRCAASERRG